MCSCISYLFVVWIKIRQKLMASSRRLLRNNVMRFPEAIQAFSCRHAFAHYKLGHFSANNKGQFANYCIWLHRELMQLLMWTQNQMLIQILGDELSRFPSVSWISESRFYRCDFAIRLRVSFFALHVHFATTNCNNQWFNDLACLIQFEFIHKSHYNVSNVI